MADNLSRFPTIGAGSEQFSIAVMLALALTMPFWTMGGGGPVCSASVNPCPIQFDSTVMNGVSGGVQAPPPFSVSVSVTGPNELMALFAYSCCGTLGLHAMVSSLQDSQGNRFTRQIYNANPGSSGVFELWTAFPSTVGSDTVTINWNDTTGDSLLIVDMYRNVAGLGATYSTNGGPSATSGTLGTLTIQQTGSWIIGGVELDQVGSAPNIIPGTGLVQRNTGLFPLVAGDAEDTNSSFINLARMTYSESWTPANNFAMGAMEILSFLNPQSSSPIITDPDNFCPTTGDSCHINNQIKSTGPTASNQALTAGTTYCTGITTAGLVTTKTSNLLVTGHYSVQDNNVTGEFIRLQVVISTTVPQTTFGTGASCATAEIFTMYFPVTGQIFTFPYSFSISKLAGTYFASLNITPLTNPVSVSSFGGSGAAGSSIALIQLA